MVWFLLLLIVILLSSRPGRPRPRPWHRWHLAAPFLALLLAGCGDVPPPAPDLGPADLAPPCGCLRAEVLGLAPFQVAAPPSVLPLPVLLQVWAVGGPFDAALLSGDVTFNPGTVTVNGISIRSPDSMLIWATIDSAMFPSLNLVLRGRTALRDALLISP